MYNTENYYILKDFIDHHNTSQTISVIKRSREIIKMLFGIYLKCSLHTRGFFSYNSIVR